jgi:hypothetical protein
MRNTVQPMADFRNRRDVLPANGSRVDDGGSPTTGAPPELEERVGRQRTRGFRQRQRRRAPSRPTPSPRLIARMRTCGPRTSAEASSARASIRCSQLSSTSRICRCRRCSMMDSRRIWSSPRGRRARSRRFADQAGIGQRRGVHQPCAVLEPGQRRRGHLQRQPRLAAPPAPVNVSRRAETSGRRSQDLGSRPTKLVSCSGRLWRRAPRRPLAARARRCRASDSASRRTTPWRTDTAAPRPFPDTCG